MAIRTTARALIVKDGHVLTAKYENFSGDIFYVLPGGGQEQGEPIQDTLHRECREELGIEVEIGQLAFICEKIFHQDEKHQIDFVYVCTPQSQTASVQEGLELDSGQLGIEWLPLMKLNEYNLLPLNIRQPIQTLEQAKSNEPLYLLTETDKQFATR